MGKFKKELLCQNKHVILKVRMVGRQLFPSVINKHVWHGFRNPASLADFIPFPLRGLRESYESIGIYTVLKLVTIEGFTPK